MSDVAERPRVALSWSGGKDSAMALHVLRQTGSVDVVSLLTVVAAEYDRVSHHGVRTKLLAAQAQAIGLPLRVVRIRTHAPDACGADSTTTGAAADARVMREYERQMAEALRHYREEGVTTIAFGDIFLQRLREYRERNLAAVGMRGLFPLWQRDTGALAREFIALGFRAVLTCVDDATLGPAFAGREFDAQLLAELPTSVDPCGEHGEFHSFVYAGPIFQRSVAVERAGVVQRDVRHFADLLPRST